MKKTRFLIVFGLLIIVLSLNSVSTSVDAADPVTGNVNINVTVNDTLAFVCPGTAASSATINVGTITGNQDAKTAAAQAVCTVMTTNINGYNVTLTTTAALENATSTPTRSFTYDNTLTKTAATTDTGSGEWTLLASDNNTALALNGTVQTGAQETVAAGAAVNAGAYVKNNVSQPEPNGTYSGTVVLTAAVNN